MEETRKNAVDSFLQGKFASCRSLLEAVSAEEQKRSTMSQWLIRNNLVVCTYKERIMVDGTLNISEMIGELGRLSKMMQGLPSSMKALPLELTVSFNVCALLLEQMYPRKPVRSSLSRTYPSDEALVSTSANQIYKITSLNLHRVLSAVGISESRLASLERLLTVVKDVAHLLPADVIMPVSLQCCLLGLCHMVTKQHQDAIRVLNTALLIQSTRREANGQKDSMSSQAFMMSLQTGNFAVDINCLNDRCLSLFGVEDLVQFLLFICLFQTGKWDDCLQYSQKEQPKLPESLVLIQKFIQGFCLYQKDNFTSALEPLQCVTASPDCDVKLKVKTLNLIGCCLSGLQKPHTAIKKFHEALQLDFSYLCPLYNISLVYRSLAQPAVELETLELLIEEMNSRSDARDPSTTADDNILGPLPTAALQEQDLLKIATHTMAQRCSKLGRHRDAASRYQDLLNLIKDDPSLLTKSPFSHCEDSSGLPSIQAIYLEVAEALYNAGDFKESLSIVNKIISKLAPRVGKKCDAFRPASGTGESEDVQHNSNSELDDDVLSGVSYYGDSSRDQRPDILDVEPSCSGAQTRESAGNVQVASEAQLELDFSVRLSGPSIPTAAEERQGCGLRHLIANSLLLKSSCLIKEKNISHASNVISELLEYLSGEIRSKDTCMSGDSDTGEEEIKMEGEEGDEASRSKKRRINPLSEKESDTNPDAYSSKQEVKKQELLGKKVLEIKTKVPSETKIQIDRSVTSQMLILDFRARPGSENTTSPHRGVPGQGVKRRQPIKNTLLEVKAKAYNNKAVILIGQKQNSKALHTLILSIQCWPDTVDALYNYVLLLTKMGRKKEASQTMRKVLNMEDSLKRSPLAKHLSGI